MKIALLDDNFEQLEKNQKFLSTLPVEIVTACTNAKMFLQEVKVSKPDVLVLDLNLGDSYMTGMEVAYELKLPVLFASSNTPEYVKEMERLKRNESLCVDHITKPFSDLEFQMTFNRFVQEVQFFANQKFVYLNFGKQKQVKVEIDTIVYFETDKMLGNASNNKRVYFSNRPPEILIDFSYTKMEAVGFSDSHFIKLHKSFRINKNHIKRYDYKENKIEVDVCVDLGKYSTKLIKVSENYLSKVKSL